MRKIMIVDDNYLSAEGIEKNIDWEVLNAEIVHICYNGTSAIDAKKIEPVDLIISDIEMPDLDGISMSRQALDINPMVKIILISAYDKFEYARRALLLGALDYIEKPLDYAYLIQKVKNMVPLLVPLFISAFRRANDLAMAMEARCYRGGEGRTKMKPLKYHKEDRMAYITVIAYVILVVVIGRCVPVHIWVF